MATALITGASGFCALHLLRRLRQEAHVRVIGATRGLVQRDLQFDELHTVDMLDAAAVSRLAETVRPDWVFHLAASLTGTPGSVYRVNVLGTVNLLEAFRLSTPGARILLVGSAAEYGPDVALPATEESLCRPLGAYATSKHCATLAGIDYARAFGMHVVIARPFNVIGAGMTSSVVLGAVLSRLISVIDQPRRIVKTGNIDTARDFVAVDDVVDAYVNLIQAGRSGEIYNLCSGQPQRVRDLIHRMLASAETSVELETDPALLRRDDPPAFYGSAAKAHRTIGFLPRTPLDQALREAWLHALRARDAG